MYFTIEISNSDVFVAGKKINTKFSPETQLGTYTSTKITKELKLSNLEKPCYFVENSGRLSNDFVKFKTNLLRPS